MRSICRHEGQNGRSKASAEDKSRNRRRALRRSAVTAALALALSGCASVDRTRDASGEFAIGGFTYAAPGPGWRGTLYPPSKSGLLFHHYRFDGDRLQFQLSQIEPAQPVQTEAAVVDWAARAGGGRAQAAAGHGAICARYSHRWSQTLSLGGPAQPWATIEERGLFCVDPAGPARLLQVRMIERLVPDGQASVNFEQLAAQLLARVRARRDAP
jgi:hypothetical protein